jgi:hypothetical protein
VICQKLAANSLSFTAAVSSFALIYCMLRIAYCVWSSLIVPVARVIFSYKGVKDKTEQDVASQLDKKQEKFQTITGMRS